MQDIVKVSVPTSTLFADEVGVLKEDNNSYFKVEWSNKKIGTYSKPDNTYVIMPM